MLCYVRAWDEICWACLHFVSIINDGIAALVSSYTHTYIGLMTVFQVSELPLNFPSPFFSETVCPPVTDHNFSYPPWYHPTMSYSDLSSWFYSFHFRCCTTFNPVSISLQFHMSKASESLFLYLETDRFQSQQFSQFCSLLPFFWVKPVHPSDYAHFSSVSSVQRTVHMW